MIAAKLNKKWVCQVTVNFGDDEELLELAARAGCVGAFIGFESLSDEGLAELGKRYNILKGGDLRASVDRIHRHGILVVGSFIMGLDSDTAGVGRRIAKAAAPIAVDMLNPLFLTPLPGNPFVGEDADQGRIATNRFPQDWRYYTLSFPVARYQNLSWGQMLAEMDESLSMVLFAVADRPQGVRRRRHWRSPLMMLVANLSYRRNGLADQDNLERSRFIARRRLDAAAAILRRAASGRRHFHFAGPSIGRELNAPFACPQIFPGHFSLYYLAASACGARFLGRLSAS